jgi:membrane protein
VAAPDRGATARVADRAPGRWSRFRRATGAVVRDTIRDVARRDLALASSGAALYGALAAIPSFLVAIALAALVLGRDTLTRYGDELATTIPDAIGAGHWVQQLFAAGLSLSPVAVCFAVFMGSAYGRGLSRALLRFAPAREGDLPPSWKSRAMTLPLLGLAPLLLLGLLLVTPEVSDLQADRGVLGVAAASYLALNAIWVITWLPLTWMFRVVGPGRPSWRAALIGGVVTGAFVSGFLQGFTLFLALPVDLGRPFGGLVVIGVTTSLLLWLWVLHAVVCVGYAFTWRVDERLTTADPR